MAALRERHPARNGVGHADRPRFHHALSVDAQSWRVRLSIAERRRHSYSDPNTLSDADSNRYCDSNSNSNTNTEAYAYTQVCANAKAAPDATAASVARI